MSSIVNQWCHKWLISDVINWLLTGSIYRANWLDENVWTKNDNSQVTLGGQPRKYESRYIHQVVDRIRSLARRWYSTDCMSFWLCITVCLCSISKLYFSSVACWSTINRSSSFLAMMKPRLNWNKYQVSIHFLLYFSWKKENFC